MHINIITILARLRRVQLPAAVVRVLEVYAMNASIWFSVHSSTLAPSKRAAMRRAAHLIAGGRVALLLSLASTLPLASAAPTPGASNIEQWRRAHVHHFKMRTVYASGGESPQAGTHGLVCPRCYRDVRTEAECSEGMEHLGVKDTSVSLIPAPDAHMFPTGCYVTSITPSSAGSSMFNPGGNATVSVASRARLKKSLSNYSAICAKIIDPLCGMSVSPRVRRQNYAGWACQRWFPTSVCGRGVPRGHTPVDLMVLQAALNKSGSDVYLSLRAMVVPGVIC